MGCGGSTAAKVEQENRADATPSKDPKKADEGGKKEPKPAKKEGDLAHISTDVTKRATKHGDRPIEDYYHVGKELGRGQFSKVCSGTKLIDNSSYAIKAVDKHNKGFSVEVLDAEVAILLAVDHPHIIKLYEVFDSPDKFYMVLEFVHGGELFDHIVERGHYSEHDASQITFQIMDAVDYLHKRNIVHRDLKPENVLCEGGRNGSEETSVKIADFGLSVIKTRDMILKTSCGTPGYVAPEVLRLPKDDMGYTDEVDLWSVGVILYILLCGFPPFYHEDVQELFDMIVRGRYDFPSPEWDSISDDAKDLIRHLLVTDPKERFTTSQALSHRWIVAQQSRDHLPHIKTSMAKWNAHRKLKGAMHAVLLARRATSNVSAVAAFSQSGKNHQHTGSTGSAADTRHKTK